MFKTTLFHLYFKKLSCKSTGCFYKWKKLSSTTTFKFMWFQRTVKIAIKMLCQYMNNPEDRLWANLIVPSANLLNVLAVVTAGWEFTISEKSRISASFLRVDVRYRVGSKIFDNCDLLPWYICCFFVKHSGRRAISILQASGQRERQNNAAFLNSLKLNSLSIDVLFGSAFSV